MEQTTPTTQSSTSSLDPTIVNLAKSIRQNESGGDFQAKGKSGEYGAYQYTPKTWASDSAKYLGQPTDLFSATPEQQNEVAYKSLADMKKSGMNVGQIASTWNSGDPEAYTGKFSNGSPSTGINEQGVPFDVPTYAKKVAQTYQSLKGGQNSQSNQTTPLNSGQTLIEGGKPMSGIQKLLFGGGAVALGLGSVLGAPETGGASLEGLPEAGALAGEAGLGGIGSGLLSTLGKFASNPIGTGLGALGVEQAGQDAVGAISKLFGGGQTQSSNTSSGTPQQNVTIPNPNAPVQEAPQPQNQQSEQDILNSINSSNSISKAISDIANSSQAGSRLMQTQAGIEGTQTIGNNGFTPDIENGRMNWANAHNDAGKKSAELDDIENQLHDAEGATGSISEVAQRAKKIVHETLPSTEWDEAYAQIDKDAESYQKNIGGGKDQVPLGSQGVGRIRREGYKAYDRNASSAKNGARKAMGSAANHHMLERTKHKDLIGGLHKEKQKLIHAQKVMQYLNGKKAPEHKGLLPNVLKKYGDYIGIAIGDKVGGPLGAVLGSIIGHHLVRAVDKKFGQSEFNSPALKKGLEILKGKNPQVYGVVKEKLKEYEIVEQNYRKSVVENENLKHSHMAWQKETGKTPMGMGEESEVSKQSKEQRMSEKRKEYKEKKKGLLEGKTKGSVYEPYKKEGLIKVGNLKKKKDNLPVIR